MPDTNDPATPRPQAPATRPKVDTLTKVVDKINASDSILVALSDNPTVDEMSAAIALTMLLDRINKHATAIFSGEIPNAIEFLRPEDTFEKNTDSLQDFIVALNKDKADHIRYMIEGDFVRIYITPYRTTIDEKDLKFSHGDYNVDLVISIDVKNSDDLDDALSEYGRIMHDATAINLSSSVPGHFADLEWTNPESSSVCEMVVVLAERLGITEFDQDIATALLTGIVAATERFSNSHTSPETLSLASRLMSSGADQQLISEHVMEQAAAAKEQSKKDQSKPEPTEPAEPAEVTTPEAPAPESQPAEDLIPTPATVEAMPPSPSPVPNIIAEAAPILQPTTPMPTPQPATEPSVQSPVQMPVPPILEPQPTQAPILEPQPTPIVATPAESAQATINPATMAAPGLPIPDIVSLPQIPYNQAPEPPTSLDQQIQPVVAAPDYGAMMDAELAAANAPQPVPQPAPQPIAQPVPQPTPQPMPPQLAPQPLIPESTTPSQLAPQLITSEPQPAPQPITPEPQPAPQPITPEPQPAPQPITPEPQSLVPEPQPTPPLMAPEPTSVPQPLVPEPTPTLQPPSPEPVPLPPLPMPPAPQPFASEPIPSAPQPIEPVVPEPIPAVQPTQAPTIPQTPTQAPTMPQAPAQTPTPPQNPTTNTSFQIPTFPQ